MSLFWCFHHNEQVSFLLETRPVWWFDAAMTGWNHLGAECASVTTDKTLQIADILYYCVVLFCLCSLSAVKVTANSFISHFLCLFQWFRFNYMYFFFFFHFLLKTDKSLSGLIHLTEASVKRAIDPFTPFSALSLSRLGKGSFLIPCSLLTLICQENDWSPKSAFSFPGHSHYIRLVVFPLRTDSKYFPINTNTFDLVYWTRAGGGERHLKLKYKKLKLVSKPTSEGYLHGGISVHVLKYAFLEVTLLSVKVIVINYHKECEQVSVD